MWTEDNTFKKLRRVSLREMASILRNKYGSENFYVVEAEPLLIKHGWTWNEYADEIVKETIDGLND